jgi:hypothetical protein
MMSNGQDWDPLDMQGLIRYHTQAADQRQANAPQPVQPLAPNGVQPQTGIVPGAPGGLFNRNLPPPPGYQPQQQQSQSMLPALQPGGGQQTNTDDPGDLVRHIAQ